MIAVAGYINYADGVKKKMRLLTKPKKLWEQMLIKILKMLI